jgi:hypothetical protein
MIALKIMGWVAIGLGVVFAAWVAVDIARHRPPKDEELQ